jgi:hypothetical protein
MHKAKSVSLPFVVTYTSRINIADVYIRVCVYIYTIIFRLSGFVFSPKGL